MPTPVKDNDSKIDDRYASGQGSYNSANNLKNAEENAVNNKNDGTAEEKFGGNSGFKNNFTGDNKNGLGKGLGKGIGFGKIKSKKVQVALFIGGLCLGIGGIAALVGGPASLLIAAFSNMDVTNNTSSSVFERRFAKVFGKLTTSSDANICNNAKKMKCRMGKISNKGLYSLHKKGVAAIFEADSKGNKGELYDGKTKRGYNKKVITHYQIDGKNIAAKDLRGFLKANPQHASKVLGIKGAFNLRVKSWAGKHMKVKFFDKFKISKAGGLAKALKGKAGNARDRLKRVADAIKSRIPGMKALSGLASKVEGLIGDKLKKGSRIGGWIYTGALAGCLVSKLPSIVAGAAAGMELLNLMPLVNDVVLSPGSQNKASGLFPEDPETSVSPEAISALGAALTEKDSNGKSALDSKYFLASIGVNDEKTGVSEYAPGYEVINNSGWQTTKGVQDGMAPVCDFILSPTVAYSAMAIQAAGGVFSFAVGFAAGWAIEKLAGELIKNIGAAAIEGIVKSMNDADKLKDLKGEKMGDALGTAATAFFSAGSMSRGIPTLSTDNVVAFQNMQKENIAEERARDIASLSPFDTSSRHTFMGSIRNTMQLSVISGGGGLGDSLATIKSIAALPFSLMNPSAYAVEGVNEKSCSYAEAFGYSKNDGKPMPAINAAGLPCTGLTAAQDSMSPDTALDLLENRGWINPDADVPDGATIEDLLGEDKFIKKDTPLEEYVLSCTNPDTGDYLFGSAGCMPDDSFSTGFVTDSDGVVSSSGFCEEADEKGNAKCGAETIKTDDMRTTSGVSDDKSLDGRANTAMAVFLIDFQLTQSINGEDDVEGSSGGSSAVAGDVVKTAVAFSWPDAGTAASKPTDGYKKAIEEYGIPGMDCGRFVGAVIRASGADPDFPEASTAFYSEYMAGSDKYEKVNATSKADLKPGDILNSPGQGHILMYIGPDAAPDGGEMAEASLGTHYGHRGWPWQDSYITNFDIFRLK